MNKEEFIFKIGTIRREANLSARALSLKIDMPLAETSSTLVTSIFVEP